MTEMNIHEVLKYLPHRYPFLMVDRVEEYEPGHRMKTIKNVTFDEPCFTGHFPHYPVFPGVLILEAMAQTTALLIFRTHEIVPGDDTLYLFVGIDKARFKRQVEPGDRLEISVELLRESRGVGRFMCEARVDDRVVCTADLMGAVRDIEK